MMVKRNVINVLLCGESQEHSHSSGTNRLGMGIVVKGFFSVPPWGNGL